MSHRALPNFLLGRIANPVTGEFDMTQTGGFPHVTLYAVGGRVVGGVCMVAAWVAMAAETRRVERVAVGNISVWIVAVSAADRALSRRGSKTSAEHQSRTRVASRFRCIGDDLLWVQVECFAVTLAAELHLLF